jgi:hypothetical protein
MAGFTWHSLPSPAWHAFAGKPYLELDVTRST